MTKLKLENSIFYVIQTDEKIISTSREEAIETFKELIAKNKDLKPEDASIIEVNTAGEKWSLQQIPLSEIAFELLRGR